MKTQHAPLLFLGESGGLGLKSESIFLLCAFQCQSTHCNLPKVAAIYAIKHVFNIPQAQCVCVLLALSHSLSGCVLFEWILSPKSSRPFLLHRRIISPSETRPTGSGSLHWPTLPKKHRAQLSSAPLFYISPGPCSHPPHQLSHTSGCPLLRVFFQGWSWVAGGEECPSAGQR